MVTLRILCFDSEVSDRDKYAFDFDKFDFDRVIADETEPCLSKLRRRLSLTFAFTLPMTTFVRLETSEKNKQRKMSQREKIRRQQRKESGRQQDLHILRRFTFHNEAEHSAVHSGVTTLSKCGAN